MAPTFRDVRDVCVEGSSGLLQALGDRVQSYNRSIGEIDVSGGAKVFMVSADEPDRILGRNLSGAWCDEIGSWTKSETWYRALVPAVRIGERPRIVATGTPRPVALIRDLVGRDDGSVHVTRGSTWENSANLSKTALDELRRRYEGTRLGRQELLGELLTDVEGALWTLAALDEDRRAVHPDLDQVVIGVDPAVTSGESSDQTGIIGMGRGVDGRGYVLVDRSCRLSPDGWARRVVQAYHDLEADLVVAEANNGGELVTHVLHTVDPLVPVRIVHASRGKRVRAEPVAALYEQHKVSHVGPFPELEDQMSSWTIDSGTSPDRLDALVWAAWALMIEHHQVIVAAPSGIEQENYWSAGSP
jgi:phage terminase large subunit-like protein